ncbi:MAG: hypothetical protein PHF67_04110, partial [Candidatus Nanoarchaeia archaeon]|nr:hypothetical protein [Candidatus Nanoarchaeia archaeon]
MTTFETLYPGTTYLLEPSYHATGYRVPMGTLGGTTSIQTANQLKEVNNLLNQGMKVTEVSVINPEVFEMIPKENFKEINRVNKLVGAESTLHLPTLDPAGFTQEGWSEENQRQVQQQFENWVQKGHDINPDGNMPVTIHASVIPGSETMPAIKELLTEEEKKAGVKEIYSKMVAVDQESGRFIPLEREKKYYPGSEGEIRTPEQELKLANESYWDQQLAQLVFYKERADELASKSYAEIHNADPDYFTEEQKVAAQKVSNSMAYLKNASMSLNSLYNHAYKFSDEKTRELLRKAAEDYSKSIDRYRNEPGNPNALSKALQSLIENMQIITDSHIAERGIWGKENVGPWKIPEKYKPVEVFAKEKTSETLSNVALKA